jgi:hypothetical protein
MRTKSNLIILTVIASFVSTQSQAGDILVDFEQFQGLNLKNLPMPALIPESNRLYDQLLDGYGVIFTSGSGYVAVCDYYRCVPSGTKFIGGSAPDNTLTWSSDYPITITFFKPGDASVPACTDFVSVHADLCGDGRPITLKAFDINGNVVAQCTKPDSGSILEVSTTDKIIHYVQFFGHPEPYFEGVGIDDLTFNTPTPPTVDISLTSAEFNPDKYSKGDEIIGSFVFHNNESSALQNVYLEVWFEAPFRGSKPFYYWVGGRTFGPYTIGAKSDYPTGELALWTVSNSANSGAYLPELILKDASGTTLKTFTVASTKEMLPVIPVGVFPALNNLLVRSPQYSFDKEDTDSVAKVLAEFANEGFYRLSLLMKTEDEVTPPNWNVKYRGVLLFNSTHVVPEDSNVLSYDLAVQAKTAAGKLNMSVDPWFVTFLDEPLITNNPSYANPDNEKGKEKEYFAYAHLPEVLSYEESIISDLTVGFGRLYIDHFRFINPDHVFPEDIYSFVKDVKKGLGGTRLAGYMLTPGESFWSGQDYALLADELDIFSPMIYWQDKFSLDPGLHLQASAWVQEQIGTAISKVKSEVKFVPCLSVGWGDQNKTFIPRWQWRAAQVHVLGFLADKGIAKYDLFYYGNWLDDSDPDFSHPIDRARYLASLGGSTPGSNLMGSSMEIRVESPVDLHVYDDKGRHAGLNYATGQVELDIPGSTYSGPGTHPQVVRIESPTPGIYSIKLIGTGMGHYTLTVTGYVGTTVTSSTQLTGWILTGEIKQMSATVSATADAITIDVSEPQPSLVEPPVGDAGGPYRGVVGQPIIFDASGSYDPDGEIRLYYWSWDPDRVGNVDNEPVCQHTWYSRFSGNVNLEIIDDQGLYGDDTAWVEVKGPERIMAIDLASHADLHVYDSQGKHLGVDYQTYTIQNIPGGIFFVLDQKGNKVPYMGNGPGEGFHQVVGVPLYALDAYRIELVGTSDGPFDLSVNELQDGKVVSTKDYRGDIFKDELLKATVKVGVIGENLTLDYGPLLFMSVLGVEPNQLQVIPEPGTLQDATFTVLETRGKETLHSVNIRCTDIVGRQVTIKGSDVTFDLNNFDVAPGCQQVVHAYIPVPADFKGKATGSIVVASEDGGTKSVSVTVGEAYIITNVYELQQINEDLTGWYVLGNDIDASDTNNWDSGYGFAPIGCYTAPFEGVFDGRGHVITRLYINQPSGICVGLFGCTGKTSEIRNVGLNDVTVTGCVCVGGLTGFNRGAIEACYVSGSVNGCTQVGGLVGTNYGLITNCYSTADVWGSQACPASIGGQETFIAGLVGRSPDGVLENCFSTGRVSGKDCAGLAGICGGECSGCFWDIETSGQWISACGIGKTTEQMQSWATFNAAGWDLVNIWTLCEHLDYPKLAWQIRPGD